MQKQDRARSFCASPDSATRVRFAKHSAHSVETQNFASLRRTLSESADSATTRKDYNRFVRLGYFYGRDAKSCVSTTRARFAKFAAIAAVGFAFCANVFAEQEPPFFAEKPDYEKRENRRLCATYISPEDSTLCWQLKRMQWKDRLSENDVACLTNALASTAYYVTKDAFETMQIHGIYDFRTLPISRDEKHILFLLERVIPEPQFDLPDGKDAALATMRALAGEKAKGNVLKPYPAAEYVAAVVLSKRLRKGLPVAVDTTGFDFTDYEARLLEYSKKSSQEAHKEIIQILMPRNIVTPKEYSLARMLATYDDFPLDEILAIFAADEFPGKYGRGLLLDCISWHRAWFTLDEVVRIRNFFETYALSSDSPHFKTDIKYFLQGLNDNEKSWVDAGIWRRPENDTKPDMTTTESN